MGDIVKMPTPKPPKGIIVVTVPWKKPLRFDQFYLAVQDHPIITTARKTEAEAKRAAVVDCFGAVDNSAHHNWEALEEAGWTIEVRRLTVARRANVTPPKKGG